MISGPENVWRSTIWINVRVSRIFWARSLEYIQKKIIQFTVPCLPPSLSFSFWNIIQSILLVFDVSPKESLDVFWMFAGQPCGRLKKWPNQHWTWRGGRGGQMKGKIKNRCYDRGCNCVTLYFLKIQNSLMGCEFGKTCYNWCYHERDGRDNVYDEV